jgi:triacylglycerol lipase
MTQKSGENDGVVPVSSAKWGEFRGVLEADHLDLLGLKLEDSAVRPQDHIKFLEQVFTDLSSKGH